MKLLPSVQSALDSRAPIVALESTIISHGMPYPTNVTTARHVEDIVRAAGAVPATIAIIDGDICVGLSDHELERLGNSKNVRKVSRRDLPIAIASKQLGATTVGATMICAHLAGIPVFVTGGIGGVHRHGESTLDVSADLTELAQTSVAVVCAGAKAILDLPRTLEVLETLGVPILGFNTDTFPAFYSRSSGLPVDARVDSPDAVANIMATKWDLGLKGGLLVTVPIPENHALEPCDLEDVIHQALSHADHQGIRGKDVTPFLLAHIAEHTKGKSLASNIALIENNAKVGAEIAVAFAALRSKKSS